MENYTVEDGLPYGIVSSVIRTGDGFMWFGTWYGVSRFDGLHFQNYGTLLVEIRPAAEEGRDDGRGRSGQYLGQDPRLAAVGALQT